MPDKVVQIAGDNADNFAARGKNRIGEGTHEPHASAPVDEPNVSLCEFVTEGVCGMAVRGVLPSLEPQLTQIRFTLHDFVKTELLDVAIAVSDGP